MHGIVSEKSIAVWDHMTLEDVIHLNICYCRFLSFMWTLYFKSKYLF